MQTNSLHAHKWGPKWTANMGIFILKKDEQKLLYDASQELNPDMIKGTELWNQIKTFIDTTGVCFFKLSTATSKDVTLDDGLGPSYKAVSVERLFKALTKSFRIMEYLEDPWSPEGYAIILTKWNDKIDLNNEYRCYICDGVCEAISRIVDCTEPSEKIRQMIKDYIEINKDSFPEESLALDLCIMGDEIIFIEFNPMDEELDRYGIIDRDVKLSEKAYAMLLRETQNYN